MLDPGVHHYYTAGLVLGTLLWESVVRPDRLPLITIGAAVVMELTTADVQPSALAGVLRLALTSGLIVAAFAWPHPRDVVVDARRPARRTAERGRPAGARSEGDLVGARGPAPDGGAI